MHNMLRMTLALALVALLSACGNKGPLVKPGQETPPAQKTSSGK